MALKEQSKSSLKGESKRSEHYRQNPEFRILHAQHRIRFTKQVESTMDTEATADPVFLQYVPDLREKIVHSEERSDPIGDLEHMPVEGLIHRYPDRLLLKLTDHCAVYCRYCFRKALPTHNQPMLSDDQLERIYTYIENSSNVREVILSGGDPLVLNPAKLAIVLRRLDSIRTLDMIRIHSRVPVAEPSMINADLLHLFRNIQKPAYLVIHVNHANEIDDTIQGVLRDLNQAGLVLLSQSVLLKGVNDSTEALENLFRTLLANRVKPYYLHHPDLVPGTSHFSVSIERGQALMQSLQGRISGIGLPSYVLDLPGGFGKMPIGPCYIEDIQDGTYKVCDYQGSTHFYPPKVV